jgi:BirA family biotin operon repressor/biotin-[acetyl-CoA-carboxylase] ligase
MEYRIIHIDETESTNKWLKDNSLAQNVRENIIAVAEYQTAGKGCGKNSWESERSKNLTFSMLIHPGERPLQLQAKEQFHITEVVSVALCKTLQPYIYNKVEIKWPNDIYVGDKKLCGILIENQLHGSEMKDCIIGIGLNVNQREFHSDAPNPLSLYQLTGQETDREGLLKAFLESFDEVMTSETVAQDYRQRLYRSVGTYAFEDANGQFMAEIARVEADGRLVLKDERGHERFYAFKEVTFIIEN